MKAINKIPISLFHRKVRLEFTVRIGFIHTIFDCIYAVHKKIF